MGRKAAFVKVVTLASALAFDTACTCNGCTSDDKATPTGDTGDSAAPAETTSQLAARPATRPA